MTRKKCDELNQFIFHRNLMELDFKRQRYTWSNDRPGTGKIRERIDMVIINLEWNACFPYTSLLHETIKGSYHCLLIIPFHIKTNRGARTFKFKYSWTSIKACKICIANAWSVTH